MTADIVEALQAADAAGDLIFSAGAGLDRKIRVRQRLPGDRDDIRAAGSDKLFHVRRIRKRADRDDLRLFHVLFDLARVLRVAAVLQEHGRMHHDKGLLDLMDAGRDMNQVDFSVQILRDPAALGHIITARVDLTAREAELDRGVLADRRADRVDYRQREAHPVLEAPAPAVRALIINMRHELMYQPAVAAVDRDHVKTAALRERGSLSELVDDLEDLLLIHLLDMPVAPLSARRAVKRRSVLHLRGNAEHAVMRQLRRGHGAVPADGPGDLRERVQVLDIAHILGPGQVLSVLGDHAVADAD